jgi:hypothetical protein
MSPSLQKKSTQWVEETISKVSNQNAHKKVGTFQFKLQVNKNITKYVVLCNIPRNIWEMPKYVKSHKIKFKCSNAIAAILGYYYFLEHLHSKKKNIYIKFPALVMT